MEKGNSCGPPALDWAIVRRRRRVTVPELYIPRREDQVVECPERHGLSGIAFCSRRYIFFLKEDFCFVLLDVHHRVQYFGCKTVRLAPVDHGIAEERMSCESIGSSSEESSSSHGRAGRMVGYDDTLHTKNLHLYGVHWNQMFTPMSHTTSQAALTSIPMHWNFRLTKQLKANLDYTGVSPGRESLEPDASDCLCPDEGPAKPDSGSSLYDGAVQPAKLALGESVSIADPCLLPHHFAPNKSRARV